MHEIKFRGKRADNGEWVYGSYQADVMSFGKHTIIYSDNEGFYCEDEVVPETVGQYTGLKDRQGIKIYTRDMIKTCELVNEEKNKYVFQRYIVVFENGCFMAKNINDPCHRLMPLHEIIDDGPWVTVIGNRFDNPELLEAK